MSDVISLLRVNKLIHNLNNLHISFSDQQVFNSYANRRTDRQTRSDTANNNTRFSSIVAGSKVTSIGTIVVVQFKDSSFEKNEKLKK